MRIVSRGMAITIAALSLAGSASAAPVETVLYSFANGADGVPLAGLIADNRGALYGTTVNDGISGIGTVFKLTPPPEGQTQWTETVLYRFKGGSDGFDPEAALIADKSGALYGTTLHGGNTLNGVTIGTVFKLTPPAKGQTAWTETVLYSFCSLSNCSDGAEPLAGLIADNSGALYGTTSEGGSGCPQSSFGCGTVFKLTPPAKGQTAWTETVLYIFCSLLNCSDGATPMAGLIADNSGALYGTTRLGGTGSDDGTVFKLIPPAKGHTAWTEIVLHSFTGSPDGRNTVAGLIADNWGALYGTTVLGGASDYGTVFKLTLR